MTQKSGRRTIAMRHFVILTKRATASGWKDLGQLRTSEAGSGFEIAQRSFVGSVLQPVGCILARAALL
jgi:hypothetical protein